MSRLRLPRRQNGLAGRLRLSGLLIGSGLAVVLATFFWNHPVSFFLFAVPGAGLIGAGMLLYLWSVATSEE